MGVGEWIEGNAPSEVREHYAWLKHVESKLREQVNENRRLREVIDEQVAPIANAISGSYGIAIEREPSRDMMCMETVIKLRPMGYSDSIAIPYDLRRWSSDHRTALTEMLAKRFGDAMAKLVEGDIFRGWQGRSDEQR